MADKLFSADQITVPQDLPKILKGFAKEIIRYDPKDIPQFAIEYFTAIKQDNLEKFLKAKQDEKEEQNIEKNVPKIEE